MFFKFPYDMILFFLLQDGIRAALMKGASDEIRDEITNDPILLRLGGILLDKLGTDRKNCIVQRLRQCARLKIHMQVDRMEKIIVGK